MQGPPAESGGLCDLQRFHFARNFVDRHLCSFMNPRGEVTLFLCRSSAFPNAYELFLEGCLRWVPVDADGFGLWPG